MALPPALAANRTPTYANLARAVTTLKSPPEFEGIKLWTKTTWRLSGRRHTGHIAELREFLLHGGEMRTKAGKVVPAEPPCGDGINEEYINYVFDEEAEDLSLGISVWAESPGGGGPFMVTALVFKDLDKEVKDIGTRLFLWLICGRYPKAVKLAMDEAKQAGKAKGYEGLCLTASQLELVPVYQRYGFQVTANACARLRTRGDYARAAAAYRDRVHYFVEDKKEADGWADELVKFSSGDRVPRYPPSLLKLKLNRKELLRKYNLNYKFYTNAAKQITKLDDATADTFPQGSGIFMDFCFSSQWI